MAQSIPIVTVVFSGWRLFRRGGSGCLSSAESAGWFTEGFPKSGAHVFSMLESGAVGNSIDRQIGLEQ